MKKLMPSFSAKTFVFLFALLITAFASKAQSNTKLLKSQNLTLGQSIISPDENSKMTLETNGNLVIYQLNTQVWQSNTAGQGVTRLAYQDDGNLVLYTAANVAKWVANSHNSAPSALVLSDSGNPFIIVNTNNYILWALKNASGYTTTGYFTNSGGIPPGIQQDGIYRPVYQDPNIGTNFQH